MGKKVYAEEFKNAADDQVIVQRHAVGSVANRLGVDYHTLRTWVELAKIGSDKYLVPTDLPPEQRIRELEKENARLHIPEQFEAHQIGKPI